MTDTVDVAIVGAGPYGLSLAAHLANLGVDFRIFGSAMHTWRTSMPEGMVLKSEGNASNIYDPAGEMTLGRFCADRGLRYKDVGYPIPLATFIDYGIAFQQRYVPQLEDKLVTVVRPTRVGFDLDLNNGEVVPAKRVVIAAGIRNYEYLPPELEVLPPALRSHSADHVRLDQFIGKEVAIIGAGASAVNLAPLLLNVKARVTIIARRKSIAYCGAPRERTRWDRIKAPESGLGEGWRSWACCTMPMVFHAMPEALRVTVVHKHLPASPGWTLKPQVDGIVPTVLGAQVAGADVAGDRARLELKLEGGESRVVTADHVIAGTGYRVDMRRLPFFGTDLLERLDCVEYTPRLSPWFEASIPGLYFVGTAAANSFGPMMRFAYGAGFASQRLSKHLLRVSRRRSVRAGGTEPTPWAKQKLAQT